MAIHADAQKAAQEELDAVIGHERFPTFSDRSSLPYVNALLKEVMRWHVSSPIGVAHRSSADDVYEGRFIPSGTLVIPNAWYVLISLLLIDTS